MSEGVASFRAQTLIVCAGLDLHIQSLHRILAAINLNQKCQAGCVTTETIRLSGGAMSEFVSLAVWD